MLDGAVALAPQQLHESIAADQVHRADNDQVILAVVQ